MRTPSFSLNYAFQYFGEYLRQRQLYKNHDRFRHVTRFLTAVIRETAPIPSTITMNKVTRAGIFVARLTTCRRHTES